jgi:hypothetical protein
VKNLNHPKIPSFVYFPDLETISPKVKVIQRMATIARDHERATPIIFSLLLAKILPFLKKIPAPIQLPAESNITEKNEIF